MVGLWPVCVGIPMPKLVNDCSISWVELSDILG